MKAKDIVKKWIGFFVCLGARDFKHSPLVWDAQNSSFFEENSLLLACCPLKTPHSLAC